jgi:nucleoside-diphosphate-sugar epimerase
MVFGFGSKKAAAKAAKNTVVNVTAPTKKGPGFQTTPGITALVTGSSGFCGARLAEMLLERGAKQVILFDICTPSPELKQRFHDIEAVHIGSSFVYCNGPGDGDLTSVAAVKKAFSSAKSGKIDVVYHIAALVGPFHDAPMYYKVNVQGTQNIIDACIKFNVPKLVNSSSPSTRFDGNDIEGAREDELSFPPDGKYTALYAETKAQAERLVTAACSDQLRTTSVSPHQVYGPHDALFLPSLLSTMGNGRLRIFGKGDKMISVCYVDNYCHGLMCGADAVENPKSPALGKFYVITDTTPVNLWDILNDAGMKMGFVDLKTKFHLPVELLYFIAYICTVFTLLTGKKTKLTPFTVRMMTIHRYFSPTLAKEELQYEPLYAFKDSWKITTDWFQEHWLPKFCKENGLEMPSSSKED